MEIVSETLYSSVFAKVVIFPIISKDFAFFNSSKYGNSSTHDSAIFDTIYVSGFSSFWISGKKLFNIFYWFAEYA